MSSATRILDPVGLDDQVENSAAFYRFEPQSPDTVGQRRSRRALRKVAQASSLCSGKDPADMRLLRHGHRRDVRATFLGRHRFELAVNATTLHSELFYHRNMTVNQNSIALSSDRGSLEIAGVSLLYEGTRVKSYLLGRDLNLAGRGLGDYYPQGMFAIYGLRETCTPNFIAGRGNSINNGCCCPEVACTPPCPPGYRNEMCNCCIDTDDAFERCTSSCNLGWALPPFMTCPKSDFKPRANHKQELKRDPGYARDFCRMMAANALCVYHQCNEDPVTGWMCCMEYCGQVLFGGGGPVGSGGGYGGIGGGGAGCGGCFGSNGGGSSEDQDPIMCCNIQSCLGSEGAILSKPSCKGAAYYETSAAMQDLARCLSCWLKFGSDVTFNSYAYTLNDIGRALADLANKKWICATMQPTDSCWNKPECTSCGTLGMLPGTSYAIACGSCETGKGVCSTSEKYFLLCDHKWDKIRAGSPVQQRCSLMYLFMHELLHMVKGPAPEWCHAGGDIHLFEIPKSIIGCCFPDCAGNYLL